MAARTPEQAVDALRARLRAIAACITARPMIATGYRVAPVVNSIVFIPTREPVVLRTHDRRRQVLFFVKHDLIVSQLPESGGYYVAPFSYTYRILDRDQNEILAYHWHPVGVSRVTHPHLHLSNRISPIDVGRDQEPLALADLHIATGPVDLATIVRMLIEEFDVQPLTDDWREILSDHDA